MKMKKIHICNWCIQGLRSHGEKFYIGDLVDQDEYEETNGTLPHCDECGVVDEELWEAIIE